MHLIYIDESKYEKDRQPYHWLCAVAIPEICIKAVDDRLNELATEYFGLLDVLSGSVLALP